MSKRPAIGEESDAADTSLPVLTSSEYDEHLAAVHQVVSDRAVHRQLGAVLQPEAQRRSELESHGAIVSAEGGVRQPEQRLLALAELDVDLLVANTDANTHAAG